MSRNGFCYAVVFDNDMFKIGGTEDIAKRLNHHTIQASKFGVSVKCTYFTDCLEDWRSSEFMMIKRAVEMLGPPCSGNEYFSGSFNDAEKCIRSLGVWVHRVKMLSPSRDPLNIVCSVEPYGPNSNLKPDPKEKTGRKSKGPKNENSMIESCKTRSVSYISKCGALTIPVLKSKMKGLPGYIVERTIESMVSDGYLRADTCIHPRNGKAVTKYSLA